MYQLVFSSSFQRQLKRLVKKNPRIKKKIIEVLKYLNKNIYHSSLKLHKISGEKNWSVSISYNIRMIIYLEKNKIFCLKIGTHDEVY